MEKQTMTPKKKRQRQFMLALPVLVLPFLTMLFWVLGGGKTDTVQAGEQKQAGFNLSLPDASFKENKPMTKMSYYEKAQQDSAKFRELVKNDPNYSEGEFGQEDNYNFPITEEDYPGDTRSGLNTSLQGSGGNNPQTEEIYQKLAQLNRELNRPVSESETTPASQQATSSNRTSMADLPTGDIDRLEQMMEMMNEPSEEDPEMQQISGMLEKILDVQHPQRVQEKLRDLQSQRREGLLSVAPQRQDDPVTLLSAGALQGTANGFFSLEEETAATTLPANAISAVIHQDQVLVNGSTVKLRLTQDVTIGGVHIPKDNFLFGVASLSGERLGVKINSIRYGESLFPVELTVYDMDGLGGIYIPGAITRDVAKESAARSTQGIGLTSLDPSLGAQAAGAGIEAARTLFNKKVKLVKVTVKAGYRVLLFDEKQKNTP